MHIAKMIGIAAATGLLLSIQTTVLAKDDKPTFYVNHSIPKEVKSSLKPSEVRVFGSAPGTRWEKVSSKGDKTYLIVLGKNDDVIAGLYDFVEKNKVKGAHFKAIGAVGAAALAFYDKDKGAYLVKKLPKQLEIVSLTGNVAVNKAGKPMVHSHAVVSKKNGSCIGGHVIYASAWPTLEILLTVTDKPMVKYKDAETGLSLYKPANKSSIVRK